VPPTILSADGSCRHLCRRDRCGDEKVGKKNPADEMVGLLISASKKVDFACVETFRSLC